MTEGKTDDQDRCHIEMSGNCFEDRKTSTPVSVSELATSTPLPVSETDLIASLKECKV